jgi:hypothetical protein
VYFLVCKIGAESDQVLRAKLSAVFTVQGTRFGFVGIGFPISVQIAASKTPVVVSLGVIRV